MLVLLIVNAIELASYGMICAPNFTNIGIDVKAILRFFLSYLKGCNVYIIDGRTYEVRH
jgi:hypothetical protein